MARNLVAASSQKLVKAAAVVTAVPFTVSGWYRPTSATTGVDKTVFCIDDGTVSNSFFVRDAATTAKVTAMVNNTASSAVSAAALSNGVWAQVGAIFTSATSRQSILNGVLSAVDSVNLTPSGVNVTQIGVFAASNQYGDGDVAEVAVWNVVLDAGELTALSVGVCPLFVRPTALVAYWPLIGQYSPEIDLWGRNELTLTNTPIAAAHPRIIYPSNQTGIIRKYLATLSGLTATQGSTATLQAMRLFVRTLSATQGQSAVLLASALLRATLITSTVWQDGDTSTQVI